MHIWNVDDGPHTVPPYMLLSPESSVIKEKKMINIGAVMIPLGTIELVMSHVAGVIEEKIGISLCIFIGTPIQVVSLTLFGFFPLFFIEVLVSIHLQELFSVSCLSHVKT